MIPNFNHNSVLPPHSGDPRKRSDLSPYECTTIEICQKFATSKDRISILINFINFRKQIRNHGMSTNAFQWIDGSFVEDIEIQENRSPRDIDVITFYFGYDLTFSNYILATFPEFGDNKLAKLNYKVDHYPAKIDHNPIATFDLVRYWSQLFSHNRSGIWKGILAIKLDTPTEDEDSLTYLNSLKL